MSSYFNNHDFDMDYVHEQYSFPSQHHSHMMQYHPMAFPPYPAHPQHMDTYYQTYAQPEYAEYAHHGVLPEEYEEGGEVLTRPRLTKEQVDVLEAQFQAHPKPNSLVKRQLAQQTKLTLPRVANWFQNRRAKAKQQRKQEEFETKQAPTSEEAWKSDTAEPPRLGGPLQVDTSLSSIHTSSGSNTVTDSPRSTSIQSRSSSAPTQSSVPDPAWASLQRALIDARKGQEEKSEQEEQAFGTMPPPELPRPIPTRPMTVKVQSELSDLPTPTFSDWSHTAGSADPWVSTHTSGHADFDFGFDMLDSKDTTVQSSTMRSSPQAVPAQVYAVSTDEWPASATSTNLAMHISPAAMPTGSSVPKYSTSRRGSTSDELTANFGTFALAGTPPTNRPSPVGSYNLPPRPIDGDTDLAARRKRPRPAPLGSAALRSRSYGALSSMSPTLRPGSSLANPHAVRHVKSTGHNLNARYAGIRKPSSAQRSPLNVASFAEAEAFQKLMVQQAISATFQEDATVPSNLAIPSTGMLNNQLASGENVSFHALEHDPAMQYHMHAAQTLHPSLVSPPSTPFNSEYFLPGSLSGYAPSVSAPLQYATLPDYTPPYSAGPMTNSSWSDAPLTSPELASFPSVAYMPSMHFLYPHHQNQEQLPSNHEPDMPKLDVGSSTNTDQKETEFFIHEFPGQREEHAHIAQQMTQNKPKSYVFNNAGPNDY